MQRGRLTPGQCTEPAHEAESLMSGREYDVPSAAVPELAGSSGCSAYDCEFVYLAADSGVRPHTPALSPGRFAR